MQSSVGHQRHMTPQSQTCFRQSAALTGRDTGFVAVPFLRKDYALFCLTHFVHWYMSDALDGQDVVRHLQKLSVRYKLPSAPWAAVSWFIQCRTSDSACSHVPSACAVSPEVKSACTATGLNNTRRQALPQQSRLTPVAHRCYSYTSIPTIRLATDLSPAVALTVSTAADGLSAS